jgi:adenosylcobinamide kinase/adenosylcobinamide-phosphate guanylyltransferase
MPLTVLLGGARSGKSRIAVELGRRWEGTIAVIATGEAGDEEMAERIRRHRAARPGTWRTIEEPIELADAIARVPGEWFLIVDCLTLWVSNLVDLGVDDDAVETRAAEATKLAAVREGPTVAVTNEVGSGVVPVNALARRYADTLGRVNSIWVEAATESFLIVAGRVVPLASVDALLAR